MNNQQFQLQLAYNEVEVEFIKSLERSYWNKNYKVWIIKANIANLEALQKRFKLWSKDAFMKHFELISSVEHPMKVELFTSPEYRNQILVKLSGYKIDVDFMKHIPERDYSKEFNRWAIPNESILINRIIDHYQVLGAKIVNRLPKKQNIYRKEVISLGERQSRLLRKFPSQYQPLLLEYSNTMVAQRYSWRSIQSYIGAFFAFLEQVGVDQISKINAQTVNKYIAQMAAKKVSNSHLNKSLSAIKFYYEKVIFRPDFEIERIKRPRKGRKLPNILSVEEIERLLKGLSNLKHKTLLYTIYSSGIRLSEILAIRINDIHWDRNQIFIRSGKGDKDRMVVLSQTLKEILKLYFDQYQPEYWLFEGQNRQHQYSSSSLQKVVRKAAQKAGITKHVTAHTIRHCFATHLMDSGAFRRLWIARINAGARMSVSGISKNYLGTKTLKRR